MIAVLSEKKEWMTTTQATRFLAVSTATIARMIREGRIKTYPHPLDRRKKLVRAEDVLALKQEALRMAA